MIQPCDDASRDIRGDVAETAMDLLKSPMALALCMRIQSGWSGVTGMLPEWDATIIFEEFLV
jgi:hypothetical protein